MTFKVGDKVQPNTLARRFLAPHAIAVPSVVCEVDVDKECVVLDPPAPPFTPYGVPIAWLELYTAHVIELTAEEYEWLPYMLRSAEWACMNDPPPPNVLEWRKALAALTTRLRQRLENERDMERKGR